MTKQEAIIAKQAEIIKLYEDRLEYNKVGCEREWTMERDKLQSELLVLQEAKEEGEERQCKCKGLPDPKDVNPYDARSAKRIHDHFKRK